MGLWPHACSRWNHGQHAVTLKPVSTVEQLLSRFDTDFDDFVGAFVRGRYAFWLGSGISRFRMPNVWELIERVVDFLRERALIEGDSGPHSVALEAVFDLSGLSDSERQKIDLHRPAAAWDEWHRIAHVLSEKYAEVLNVPVGTEPSDYLVWTALDVPGTYGDDTIEPDVEHLCVALLMLEGIVSTAVTANWDGLIEKAFSKLSESPDDDVRVIVKDDEFRTKTAPRELIKFHGCAVRAVEDEAQYRSMLIARLPQISGWTENGTHSHMKSQLEARFSDQATLMMGLSAQDANMHTMFYKASSNLGRKWKTEWPAVVLSEESLRSHHRGVLEATYSNYDPTNREDIANGAVLGAWAKPVLVALLLCSLTEKVVDLVAKVDMPLFSEGERSKLNVSLRDMRDLIGVKAADGTFSFVEALVDSVGTVVSIFRTGQPLQRRGLYEPLSEQPVGQAANSKYFPSEQLGRLGIILSLVSRGSIEGAWGVHGGTPTSLSGGSLGLVSGPRNVRLFIVKDNEAWVQLADSEDYDGDDPDVLVVHAGRMPRKSQRSPRSRKRTGQVRAAHMHIASVCDDATTADDLFDEFKQAGGFA